MIDFNNQILDLEDLPRFENVEGHPVDRAYLKVLRIQYIFWSIVFFLGFFDFRLFCRNTSIGFLSYFNYFDSHIFTFNY